MRDAKVKYRDREQWMDYENGRFGDMNVCMTE